MRLPGARLPPSFGNLLSGPDPRSQSPPLPARPAPQRPPPKRRPVLLRRNPSLTFRAKQSGGNVLGRRSAHPGSSRPVFLRVRLPAPSPFSKTTRPGIATREASLTDLMGGAAGQVQSRRRSGQTREGNPDRTCQPRKSRPVTNGWRGGQHRIRARERAPSKALPARSPAACALR